MNPKTQEKKLLNQAIYELQAAKTALSNASGHISKAHTIIDDNFPDWEDAVEQSAACSLDVNEVSALLNTLKKGKPEPAPEENPETPASDETVTP